MSLIFFSFHLQEFVFEQTVIVATSGVFCCKAKHYKRMKGS